MMSPTMNNLHVPFLYRHTTYSPFGYPAYTCMSDYAGIRLANEVCGHMEGV